MSRLDRGSGSRTVEAGGRAWLACRRVLGCSGDARRYDKGHRRESSETNCTSEFGHSSFSSSSSAGKRRVPSQVQRDPGDQNSPPAIDWPRVCRDRPEANPPACETHWSDVVQPHFGEPSGGPGFGRRSPGWPGWRMPKVRIAWMSASISSTVGTCFNSASGPSSMLHRSRSAGANRLGWVEHTTRAVPATPCCLRSCLLEAVRPKKS